MRKLLLAAIIIFAGFWVTAQNISVSSFERRDNDMDARVNYPVKDQNGDVCALIKVETTQTGFVFEGGSLGIMKTERKTGEYWVYIPWGSKRITIKHDQLGILRDYTFPESIEKATVYLMKLTSGKVTQIVEDPEILTQWVVITSTPDGAQVYIDDKPVGTTPFSREYTLGQHSYRIEIPMHYPDAGLFTLDGVAEKVRVNAILKPNFGSINVNSSPENGADVLLDGKPTGQKTPCTLTDVLSGNHRITIKKSMYYDSWQEVAVEDGKSAEALLNMKPAYGEIIITTNPSADIYIDDVKVGSDSYKVRKSSGFYIVEARKEKHSAESKKVEVVDGQTVQVSLAPVPQYGILKISSNPPDAEIYIDGVKKGSTPSTLRQMLVGEYNVEIRLQGYASYFSKTTIKFNETIEISQTLNNGIQVLINSNPVGAALEIDEVSFGKTPFNGSLSDGNHNIKLTNGNKVVSEVISITRNGKSSWNFDLGESENSFTDERDGNIYKWVTIGNQVWMDENLRYLPSVVDPMTGSLTTKYYYVYDYSGTSTSEAIAKTNYATYGVLYNWPAAMDDAVSGTNNTGRIKGVCPTGWHLPSDEEWTLLADYLGGTDVAGGKLKEAKTAHWSSPNSGASNSTGFRALPGGSRANNGDFVNLRYSGNWWSASENGANVAWYRGMYQSTGGISRYFGSKDYGFSVRCVKD